MQRKDLTRRQFIAATSAGSVAASTSRSAHAVGKVAGDAGKLAILGGTPIRKEAWPEWPYWDEAILESVVDATKAGVWCRIHPNASTALHCAGRKSLVSFGVERQLARDWVLSADYVLNRGTNLIRSRDINLRQIGDNEFTLPGLDPRFVQVNQIETSGSSTYHGFTAKLRKRFAQDFSLMASYTFGKAIDDTTDFITQLQANNQRDLRSDKSLSTFDQRQRFVFSGVYQSPWSVSGSDGFVHNLFADWTFAPIITIASGRPFNLLLGYDLNGDTHEETDRPVLAVEDSPIVGRNTGRGPAFSSVDIRLARRFMVSEQMNFEFVFEAFNLFNNVNYSGVNNVFGTTELVTGDVEGSSDISSNQPLGFTSAFAPRQIQFGFKFNF